MAKNQQRQTDGQTEESKKRENYLLFRWRGESAFSVPPVEKEKKSVKGGREREREGGRERRGEEGNKHGNVYNLYTDIPHRTDFV